MCGRFTQYEPRSHYIEALNPNIELDLAIDEVPIGRYNVAPGTRVLLLNQRNDKLHLDPVLWGYQPAWAKGSKRPPMINARVETVATSRMFKPLFEQGRTLVMADGWYEWKKSPSDPKVKQPYFIHHRAHAPLFFAAIARHHPEVSVPPEDDGFVIITAQSDAGLVDIHDRRPLVLGALQASKWLNPEISASGAMSLLGEGAVPPEEFDWYPVSKAVGNIRNNSAELIHKISSPLV
jgi:putative SOS response-associated peptidase YedK